MNEIGWGDNTCVARLDFADDGSIVVVYENDALICRRELSTFACIGWKNAKGIPVSPQIWFRRADPNNPQDVDKIVEFMRELHRNAYGTDEGLDPAALLRDVERAQQGLAALVHVRSARGRNARRARLPQDLVRRGAGRRSARRLLHQQRIPRLRSERTDPRSGHQRIPLARKDLAVRPCGRKKPARAGLLSQIRLRAARRAPRCERPALPHVQAPDGGIIRLDKAASPLYTLSE